MEPPAPEPSTGGSHRPLGDDFQRPEPAGRAVVDSLKFDDRGLVPCVIQDWRSGEVLTLAYMNEEALRLTRETGEVHLFSRSRGERTCFFTGDLDAAPHEALPGLERTLAARAQGRPEGSYTVALLADPPRIG